MKKIYSNVEPNVLLHIVVRKEDVMGDRLNVSPDEEYLQLAVLNMKKGKTFRPHKHILYEKVTDIAQESWCVVTGKVNAVLYDLDDEIISEEVLNAGDISMTFRGGHTYEFLEDSYVCEYKTGPYFGQENDKVFIDGK